MYSYGSTLMYVQYTLRSDGNTKSWVPGTDHSDICTRVVKRFHYPVVGNFGEREQDRALPRYFAT
jgi:hypothetical protein